MCAAGMSEKRLREIVREEILAARLSEEDHHHPSSPTTTTTWLPSATSMTSPTITAGSTPTPTTSTTGGGADRGRGDLRQPEGWRTQWLQHQPNSGTRPMRDPARNRLPQAAHRPG